MSNTKKDWTDTQGKVSREESSSRLARPVTLLIQPDPWLWSKEKRAVMASWVRHSPVIAGQVHRDETGPR